MTAQHGEFPGLTPETRAAFDAALNAITRGGTISLIDLRRALADNLHSPPPSPPTLAEARKAARQLAGADAEIVHAFLASLGEAP